MRININEIKENMEILASLKEEVKLLDNKKVVAFIIPNKFYKNSLTKKLAGSLKNKTYIKIKNLDKAIKEAFEEEIKSKYE